MPDSGSPFPDPPTTAPDSPRPTVILGAGVSGLVAADILAAAGHRVVILEPYERLGGNQKSRAIGDYTFDIGSFVLTAGGPFFQRFPGAEALCLPARMRLDRITPQGRVTRYPYSIGDDLLRRGPLEWIRTVVSLCLGRLGPPNRDSAASYARRHLGDRLFRQSGLHAYIERLCGLPADQVDYRFAEKRMAWIANTLSAQSLAIRLRPGKKQVPARTLVRPREGFEAMYDQVAAQLAARNVTIRLNTAVEKILPDGAGFNIVTSQGVVSASRLISSIPLTLTAEACGVAAGPGIDTMPLLSLYVTYAGDPGFESEVLYNFSNAGAWKRLTMHSRIYGQVDGREYFSVEIPLADGEADANRAFADFLAFMRRHGLLQGDAELIGHDVTGHAYPVYAHGSIDASTALMERIEATGVEMLGRQGRFDYIPTATKATQLATARMRDKDAATTPGG